LPGLPRDGGSGGFGEVASAVGDGLLTVGVGVGSWPAVTVGAGTAVDDMSEGVGTGDEDKLVGVGVGELVGGTTGQIGTSVLV
jgi:hypothetical protein